MIILLLVYRCYRVRIQREQIMMLDYYLVLENLKQTFEGLKIQMVNVTFYYY